MTGWTFSTDFPTSPLAYDADHNGSADIFVSILNADGAELLASTYLGGAQDDRSTGLALATGGDLVVAGYSASPDFPATAGAWDGHLDGAVDATVTRLAPDGSDLVFSTFLGGAAEDWASGLILDAADRAYVTGRTWSADFPTTPDAIGETLDGGRDGFLAQLSTDGKRLGYGSYLGGSDWDDSLAISASGEWLALAGATRSADFPVTTNAYDDALNGDYDSFVLRLERPQPVNYPIFLPVVRY